MNKNEVIKRKLLNTIIGNNTIDNNRYKAIMMRVSNGVLEGEVNIFDTISDLENVSSIPAITEPFKISHKVMKSSIYNVDVYRDNEGIVIRNITEYNDISDEKTTYKKEDFIRLITSEKKIMYKEFNASMLNVEMYSSTFTKTNVSDNKITTKIDSCTSKVSIDNREIGDINNYVILVIFTASYSIPLIKIYKADYEYSVSDFYIENFSKLENNDDTVFNSLFAEFEVNSETKTVENNFIPSAHMEFEKLSKSPINETEKFELLRDEGRTLIDNYTNNITDLYAKLIYNKDKMRRNVYISGVKIADEEFNIKDYIFRDLIKMKDSKYKSSVDNDVKLYSHRTNTTLGFIDYKVSLVDSKYFKSITNSNEYSDDDKTKHTKYYEKIMKLITLSDDNNFYKYLERKGCSLVDLKYNEIDNVYVALYSDPSTNFVYKVRILSNRIAIIESINTIDSKEMIDSIVAQIKRNNKDANKAIEEIIKLAEMYNEENSSIICTIFHRYIYKKTNMTSKNPDVTLENIMSYVTGKESTSIGEVLCILSNNNLDHSHSLHTTIIGSSPRKILYNFTDSISSSVITGEITDVNESKCIDNKITNIDSEIYSKNIKNIFIRDEYGIPIIL